MAKFKLSDCPVLRGPRRRWAEEDVMVAQDWALERGYEKAALWTMWTMIEGTRRPRAMSPKVIRETLAANVEPLEATVVKREAIEALDIDYPTAATIVGLIEGRLNPDQFGSVREWAKQCYNRPSRTERIMMALNEVLGGSGVEAITVDPEGDIVGEYVNLGDSYTPTVVHFEVELAGFVAPGVLPWAFVSWGDVVEFIDQLIEDDEYEPV